MMNIKFNIRNSLNYTLLLFIVLFTNNVWASTLSLNENELTRHYESLNAKLSKAKLSKLSNAIQVLINSETVFEPNSSELKLNKSEDLLALIETLKRYNKNEIIISIHTETDGDAGLNLLVAEKRAAALEKFLSKEGVKSSRFKCIGFGEVQPLGTQSSEHKIQNDRIEFLIIY